MRRVLSHGALLNLGPPVTRGGQVVLGEGMAKKEVSILGSPTQSLPVLALGAEADPGVHDSGSTRSAAPLSWLMSHPI